MYQLTPEAFVDFFAECLITCSKNAEAQHHQDSIFFFFQQLEDGGAFKKTTSHLKNSQNSVNGWQHTCSPMTVELRLTVWHTLTKTLMKTLMKTLTTRKWTLTKREEFDEVEPETGFNFEGETETESENFGKGTSKKCQL
jgi:hypothetical protein